MSLTSEEIKLVSQLRASLLANPTIIVTKEEAEEEIKEIPEKSLKKLNDDVYLVRWLRARDLDLERGEQLLRDSLLWRLENKIDTLLGKEIDCIYSEKYPREFECLTKDGYPVILIPFGTWDVPYTVLSPEQTKDFMDYTFQGCEMLMEEIDKADEKKKKSAPGERISQCVLIIDMAGFSFMNLLNIYAVQNGLSLLQQYEANYPETLHSCYLINSSSAINMLLSLVKGVLAQKTFDKIKVFTTDAALWSEALLDIINEEDLPVAYGGTKEEDVAEEVLEDSDDDEFVEAVEEQ